MNDKNNRNDDVKKVYMNHLKGADELFEGLLDLMNIDREDSFYRDLMRGVLQRQSKNQIVLILWQSASDDQLKHLRQYMNEMSVIEPSATTDDLLMRFVLLYDELAGKVVQGLSRFFEKFVEDFKRNSA